MDSCLYSRFSAIFLLGFGCFLGLSVVAGHLAMAEEARQGIMVWELEQKTGVSATDIDSISGIITAKVEKYSGKKVVSEADIKTVLKGEETRQKCGTEDANSCMAEIGAALGVPEAVSGDLGYVDGIWVLNLRRVNLRTVGVIRRASRQIEGKLADVVRKVPSVVAELFGKKRKGMLTAGYSSKHSTMAISGYSLLGGGAAFMILGGIATWQMDEANQNDKSRFDTWKNVSIAGYAIGGTAILTGAGLLIANFLQKKKPKSKVSIFIMPNPSGISAGISGRW